MIKRVDENGLVHLVTNIRKPRKWRRYEYLESSGTQYIDTGIGFSTIIKIELSFVVTNSTNTGIIIGAYYDRESNPKHLFYTSDNKFSVSGFTSTIPSLTECNVNLKYYVTLTTSTVDSINTGVSMYLFARNNDIGSIIKHKGLKIYSTKIYSNNQRVRDFVPAEYNGLYGMWDLVEDKFYPNKGTGTFTVGPEMKNYDEIYEVRKTTSLLPAGVELYDYILSSGTLYIDTGWVTDYTKSFEITSKYNASSTGTRGCILSSYNAGRATSLEVTTNSRFWLHDGNIDNNIAASVGVDHISIFSYGEGTWKHQVDGGTANTGSASYSDSAASSAWMFCDRDLRTTTFNKIFKMYYLSIKENGVLIRNFLPCTYLGEPGMWDTVENKFYRNQGTGLFTLGNKITLKEYEYLLSTGTLWIDTKYTVGPSNAPNIKLYVDVKATSTGVGNRWWVHGIGGGSSVGSLHVGIGNGSSGTTNLPFVYGNGRADITTTVKGNLGTRYKYTLDLKNQTYNITNESGTSLLSLSNIARGVAINTLDMVIYAWRRANTGAIGSSHSDDLYEYKLWDNDILVRHMIPVSYNGTPGLWDKVEWKFYANAGSGSFTLGPEKASGTYPVWTPIEYLESTGTLYINTGYVLKNTDIVDIIYDNIASGFVFGSRESFSSKYSGVTNESTGQYNIRYGNTTIYNKSSLPSGTVTVHIENGNTKVNGSIVSTTTYGSSFYSNNCYIFTINDNGTAFSGAFGTNRIRRFSILGICDMIPVRIGTTGYMFDKVTGKMYGNSGTGNFILGPDINL